MLSFGRIFNGFLAHGAYVWYPYVFGRGKGMGTKVLDFGKFSLQIKFGCRKI